jgi:hypothetical protein
MSSFAKAKLSFVEAKMKTPPASEDTGGVFHAFTSFEVAALGKTNFEISFSFRLSQIVFRALLAVPAASEPWFRCNHFESSVESQQFQQEEMRMKRR